MFSPVGVGRLNVVARWCERETIPPAVISRHLGVLDPTRTIDGVVVYLDGELLSFPSSNMKQGWVDVTIDARRAIERAIYARDDARYNIGADVEHAIGCKGCNGEYTRE